MESASAGVSPNPQLAEQLRALADYRLPLTLRLISDFGVADQLAAGPRTPEEIAPAVGLDPLALDRALRALSTVGVFQEVERGRYGLTPLSDLLRSDVPDSVRASHGLIPSHVQAWALAAHSLRTGQPAFELAHGQPYWEYLSEHPDQNRQFNSVMEGITREVAAAAIPVYDWSAVSTVVDVGGGTGELLARVLLANQTARGILVDLPHVLEDAPPLLERLGVSERCSIVEGSFFDSLPPSADIYMLKSILHDWDDERALAILRSVRKAMRSDSRLLVLDTVIPEDDEAHLSKVLDLAMLVVLGGRERTVSEFASLLAAAGLRLERVIPTATPHSILEATTAA